MDDNRRSASLQTAGEGIYQEYSQTVISLLDLVRHRVNPDSIIFEDLEHKAWTLGYLEKRVYQVGVGFDTGCIETTRMRGLFQVRLEYGQDLQPSHFVCRNLTLNVEAASALSFEELKQTMNLLIASVEPSGQ